MNDIPLRSIFAVAVALTVVSACSNSRSEAAGRSGREIYRAHCARCHGGNGQGVPKVHKKPLTGNKSIAELTKVIAETMPEEKPELCVGDDAKKVARYIYNAFYSPKARAKGPARIELARLTVPQYYNSVADLLTGDRGPSVLGTARGLNADYFKTRRFRNNERVARRVDSRVDFRFAGGSPHDKIKSATEFSIRWQGTVIAEDSGVYEFAIKTENGARLWVNNRRTPLIDAWVASAGRAKTHTATIRLLGGRAYPIRLECLQVQRQVGLDLVAVEAPAQAPRRDPHQKPVTAAGAGDVCRQHVVPTGRSRFGLRPGRVHFE